MQYMQPSSSLFFFHKDNIVMFSISKNTIKLLKEFLHTDLINMCYSSEMCVTRVDFSVTGGNNQAQHMEIKFFVLNKKHLN